MSFSCCLILLFSVSQVTLAQSWEPPGLGFGSDGFANWGFGSFPPSVGTGGLLEVQEADAATLDLLSQVDPDRIGSYIQTLVDFHTRHTLSDTNSSTIGIGAARRWLMREMEQLAEPSNGAMEVSMPCYTQEPDGSRITRPVDICNVQVEITGSVDPNRTYVYTGHYDSRRLEANDATGYAPGADDNASAVAVALEMIRILAPVVAKTPPAASIIIAAVAGEEQGLYGSNFLAQTLKSASRDVQGNFNADVVGSGSNEPFDPLNKHAVRLYTGSTAELTLDEQTISRIISNGYQDDTPSRHMARYIQEVNAGAADATGMEVSVIYKADRSGRGGDHLSFLDAGFPAVRFTEPNENFFHQHQNPRVEDGIVYGDEIEFVDFEYTARVGKVVLLGIWSIANSPSTPANFTFDTRLGVPASSESTPPETVENFVQLYYNTESDPLLDYYEVVWRALGSQQWTHQINVGTNGSVGLSISKDNAVFGLRAVAKDGKKSPAMYAIPFP